MALAGTHHIRRRVTDSSVLAVALSGELGVLAITDTRALLVSIFNMLDHQRSTDETGSATYVPWPSTCVRSRIGSLCR